MVHACKLMLATLLVIAVLCGVQVLGQSYTSATPKDKKYNFTPKLPKNLCKACTIDTSTINTGDGSFDKPATIFNIQGDANTLCMKKLKKYTILNPDDVQTKDAYAEFVQTKDRSGKAYQRLERIAYTYCELCCDCIDALSPKDVPKLDIKRPNCALHYVYDVITERGMFPDAKYQNYATKAITGGVIAPDNEVWLKCKTSSRIMIRTDQGIEGYFDGRRKLKSLNMSAREEPIFDEEALRAISPPKSSSRKLAQDNIDCSDTSTVSAAENRLYADLDQLTDWIGCGSAKSYKACHYMEYCQGRVCDGPQSDDSSCIGKDWVSYGS